MKKISFVFLLGLVLSVMGCDSSEATGRWLDEGDATVGGDVESDGRSPGDVETADVGVDVLQPDDVTPEDGRATDAHKPDGVGADINDRNDASDPEDTVAPTPDDASPADPDPPTPPDPVSTMRFGTLHWNIAGGKENDCKPPKITRAVMRYVRNAPKRIDFISLNEVCPAQYDSIRHALKNYWNKRGSDTFSAFKKSGRSRVGSAIFSRRNIEAITQKDIGEDQWGKRYLICGRQVGRRIRVCTAHLSPGDSKARRQLGRVLPTIENWWKNRRDTVIIAGDFNIHPDDRALNAMYARAANTRNNPNNDGHYRELDDNNPNHCKGYGQRSQPGSTGGPCNTGRKIDFIFARANRIVGADYSGGTLNIPRDCSGVCSDHRAVRGYAKLKYRTD